MQFREMHERLKAKTGDDSFEVQDGIHDPAVIVRPERLREVCAFLRDDEDLSMKTLRIVTGIDRPSPVGDADSGKGRIELVYHLCSYQLGHGIVIKTQVDRESPMVDTVQDIWPTANWHEREAFDLLGVVFKGHPDLRRIMMPEDWVGHPLRKDYVPPEEYHGIPCTRESAMRRPRLTRVAPAMHEPRHDVADERFIRLNMGPHHPATHGVLNFLLETDGEILRRVIPDVGYLHRGMEKMAEEISYQGTMPFTDRIDYLGAMFTNHGWAMACEKLFVVEVPRRAEICRVIASELNRLASHFIATGVLPMELGAFTPFIHWLRERETINDIMERICGARLTYNYMRIGGVSRDIDRETVDKILRWSDHFEPILDEFNRLITTNEIFVKRLSCLAPISAETAVAYGLVGPNLRASGVEWDIRRNEPYSIYGELDFDVITGKGWRGQVGDAYDRFMCRILEMRESVKIIRQACDLMEEGPIRTAAIPKKPEVNEVYTRTEGPRGEAGFYVVSNGSDKPYRARFRTGSFTAMSVVEAISPGLMLADLIALIGSLDTIAPEVDR
jgi:NADH-quinone oxidoreductase subunit D